MKLLAGTSKGVFAIGESHEPATVLPERSVRDLARAGDRLLAGADTGIFASDDGGHTWQPSGIEGRTVWDILAGPDPGDDVYVGTQPAGLYRSDDAGRTWKEMETLAQAPGAERWCVPVTPRQGGRARALVVDRADPKRIWVGVEVGGVASTDDGGATWRVDLPGGNPDIHMMAAHPAKPEVLFASTGYGRHRRRRRDDRGQCRRLPLRRRRRHLALCVAGRHAALRAAHVHRPAGAACPHRRERAHRVLELQGRGRRPRDALSHRGRGRDVALPLRPRTTRRPPRISTGSSPTRRPQAACSSAPTPARSGASATPARGRGSGRACRPCCPSFRSRDGAAHMKFGVFYEHQLPRPWVEGSEQQLFQDALSQVELADRLGIDYAWEVEHHFLEEYSHSSAPEVFLAAASQRTKRIRLGHGIVLMPPGYNHPARVAERIATLDLVSNGRADFGTGESASRAELEGFGIDPGERRAMWRESVEQVANMMAMDPYPGFSGKYFSMPARNVVPKPVQKPHPPLWVACSNRNTIHLAAQLGIGALTFAFIDPAEARQWVADYYETFKRECVPIGHAVNPSIAMVTGFSCHADAAEAARRGADGFRFFQFALGHHYSFGTHTPGRTNIWNKYVAVRDALGTEMLGGGAGCIGTPDDLRTTLRTFQDAGVDQTIFIQQGGKNRHEDICESLELFAAAVMPEFHGAEAERHARKMADLAPHIEAAFARKDRLKALADDEIPSYPAYGLTVAEPDPATLPEANRRRRDVMQRMREIMERTR